MIRAKRGRNNRRDERMIDAEIIAEVDAGGAANIHLHGRSRIGLDFDWFKRDSINLSLRFKPSWKKVLSNSILTVPVLNQLFFFFYQLSIRMSLLAQL